MVTSQKKLQALKTIIEVIIKITSEDGSFGSTLAWGSSNLSSNPGVGEEFILTKME